MGLMEPDLVIDTNLGHLLGSYIQTKQISYDQGQQFDGIASLFVWVCVCVCVFFFISTGTAYLIYVCLSEG